MPPGGPSQAHRRPADNPLRLGLAELNGLATPPEVLPEGQAWPARREVIEGVWRQILGPLDEPGSGEVTLVRQQVEDGLHRWSVQFDGGAAGAIPAQILLPAGVLAADAPAPAVIACHPTHPDGKDSVTAGTGTTKGHRPYGLELAQRGYVVIAPDCLSAGERIYPGHRAYDTGPFYREHPGASIVGRTITDHRSALNALISLPFVDPDRIGALGHSLGGYNAYFLAGLDERVKAVVSSCGFGPFRHDPEPGRWGQRDWYTHLPEVSAELDRGAVPFDFGQIAALVAPRPFFHYFGQMDAIFPHWRSVAESLQSVRRLYVSLGHEDRFELLMGGGPHDFPESIRSLSYRFLDHWLGMAPESVDRRR